MRDGLLRTVQLMPVRRAGSLAAFAASLMMSACSQTPELLSSAELAPAETSAAASPRGELQRATAYWGQEFAKEPTKLEPALNYAKNLKALGEKQKAMSVLQQASTLHSDSRELASEYGRLALEFDQVSVADKLLAMADDPTKPDWKVISARGTVLAKQGRYTDAIPFYDRALALSANQPSVLNNLAMAHAMLGDAQKAEGILRSAGMQPAATAKVRENLALVLELQGRHEEANKVAALAQRPIAIGADGSKQVMPAQAEPVIPTFDTKVAQSEPAPAPALKPTTVETHAPAPVATTIWQTDVETADAVVPAQQ